MTHASCLGVLLSLLGTVAACPVAAQEHSADELAKKLSNPVAALISVPFQYNYDQTYGQDGYRHNLNIQPVAPFSMGEHWNVISRTILPVTYQKDVVPGTDQAGIGDITQSFFFSPKEAGSSGVIWGIGPALLIPTGTDDLGADTWAAGPTVVLLKQEKSWTYGALMNHLADVAGTGSRRADISSTFLQPFLSKAYSGGRTLTFNVESTYDWKASQWTVPLNIQYSKVSKLGNQMLSFQGGVRVYLETPRGGPDWGLRLGITLLFPR
ncbi:transporter [Stenotrophomonas oahuensis]|uniref:Transporter n=1 Tax=Stenotrophomonas oahuensis TaxID=3003271 RepID=A0ABY9YP59_9GAMM|nr:transporter [Stenotrophomonas sp. A5586]WNH52019.1 transporter [Stenotrophomonas sp. A5586]